MLKKKTNKTVPRLILGAVTILSKMAGAAQEGRGIFHFSIKVKFPGILCFYDHS